MRNRITGAFGTTQVGAMQNFRKVEDEYGISLIGEARLPKREYTICERVAELYDRGELNFSFEIRYTEDHVIQKDGVLYIDAAEHNVITGMAIVSVPAYEESFALSLVAEENTEVDPSSEEVNKGVENMDEVEKVVEELTVAEELAASENTNPETVEAINQIAEAESAEAENNGSEQTIAEETPEEDADEKADNDDIHNDEDSVDNEKDEDETVAEAEIATAKSEADWAVEYAQYAALQAEIASLRAQQASLEAEIERLKACEVELEAINAAKEAERLINEQNRARAFAQKQGLDVANEAVASAIESLDYTKIAELTMALEENTEQTVTVASYATVSPLKIKNRFENVLKRVSE